MGEIEERLILDILKSYSSENRIIPLLPKDIDWNILFELSIEHKVLPTVYRYLKGNIPSEFKRIYNSYYYGLMSRNRTS